MEPINCFEVKFRNFHSMRERFHSESDSTTFLPFGID